MSKTKYWWRWSLSRSCSTPVASRSVSHPDLTTVEEYLSEPIDLALVDLNLRDGPTGPQIGKLLCDKGVTVLFMTANPRMLGDGIAITIGVLTKPTDPETVRCAVNYALGVRQGKAVDPPAALKIFG